MSSVPNSHRPLKVLHVGNIANNAYNNAKIQRQRGIEADVLCFDYYHIMSCPEWEDADFTGDYGDPYYPDWTKCNLNGFERPKWFVQGPIALCLEYLFYKSLNDTKRANEKWVEIHSQRMILTHDKLSIKQKVKNKLFRIYEKLLKFKNNNYLWEVESKYKLTGYELIKGLKISFPIINFQKSLIKVFESIVILFLWLVSIIIISPPLFFLERLYKKYTLSKVNSFSGKQSLWLSSTEIVSAQSLDQNIITLIDEFKSHFPDRDHKLTRDDLLPWTNLLSGFKKIFDNYDIVQMYATYPIIPLLCDTYNFAAYEHGTIREIPFEENAQGRVCAIGYKLSPVVFVTNTDCLEAVDKLNLNHEKVYCLPHAFDSDKLQNFKEDNKNEYYPELNSVTFFSPTRQHWIDKDPSFSKGNDVIFYSVAELKNEGYKFRIELVEWGIDVEASKKLIKKLSIEDFIIWVPQMSKKQLWKKYLTANAVIDQFMLPALGGVGFEVMALGKRLLTAMDMDQAERFFGASPILYDVRDQETLTRSMKMVLDDPTDQKEMGNKASDWIQMYHSADRICQIQMNAYQKLLSQLNS